MKLGIIGLPGSGRSTIFEVLTHSSSAGPQKNESKIGTVRVPDKRVDVLSDMYKPRKTIYAQIEYFLPRSVGHAQDNKQDQSFWAKVRESDALVHVVRNFLGPRPHQDHSGIRPQYHEPGADPDRSRGDGKTDRAAGP